MEVTVEELKKRVKQLGDDISGAVKRIKLSELEAELAGLRAQMQQADFGRTAKPPAKFPSKRPTWFAA